MKMLMLLLLCAMLAAGCGQPANNSATAPDGGRMYKIAFAYFGPEEACDNCISGVMAGLKAEGFEEGKNLEIIKRHAGGEIANIPGIMQSLEAQGIDIIVPMSTPCVAGAANTIKNTNVVFCYTYDPLGAGVGKSLTDHLPNFTGIASFPPVTDTIKYMRVMLPQATKLGTLYNPAEPNSVKAVKVAREALAGSNVTLEEVTVANTNEVMQAAQALLARGVQGVWLTGDNTAIQALESIIKVTQDAKIPLILNDPEYVQRGATGAFGIGWVAVGEAGGRMMARVLRGEKPATMPIVELAGRRVIISDTNAQAIGLAIPAEVRALVTP
ncbi:MAG TPA: ABC transporter substrate-binding protein [bacterium]|nr:ABC transporter substrate-binding protein [bacterium]